MSQCIKLLLILLFGLGGTIALSQGGNRNELEKRKKDLQKEIKLTTQLIQETRKSKTASLSQLKGLQKKLNDRVKLINTIQNEIDLLSTTINVNDRKIGELESDLTRLKKSFAKIVRQAYMNKNQQSALMLVFSSKDFHQAYKRLYYLRSYSNYRQEQAKLIKLSQAELSERVVKLKTDLSSKRVLLGTEEQEKVLLNKEKKDKEVMLSALKKKEKGLKKDLEKKEAASRKLDKEIQRVIEGAIAKERERAAAKLKAENKAIRTKAEKEGKPVPVEPKVTSAPELKVTPETKALSGKFEAHKGQLPWPVEKGVISESFGAHAHPVLRGITTYNNGVDIATTKGASVRSIYDGEVMGVISIPGSNMAVIVKHGEYLSVYGNLANASVQKGQKVKAGAGLGTADTDEDGKTEAHLEIWKGKVKLNPSMWIAR